MAGSYVSKFGLVFDVVGAEAAVHVFDSISSKLIDFGKDLLDVAGKVESTKTAFMYTFSKALGEAGAQGAFDRATEAGLRMVQTTDDVLNMTSQMQRMAGINIFDPKIDEAFKGLKGAKGDMADLLGDIAALNPYGTEGVTRAFSEGLAGQWTAFAMRLDLSKEQVNELKKSIGGTTDATEKMVKMLPFLYEKFGGQAAAMANTWKFLTSQLGDIKDKLWSTLGTPMMDALKGPLKSLIDYFVGDNGLLNKKNITKLEGLKTVFGQIGEMLAKGAKAALGLMTATIEFVSQHPGVLKFVLALAGGVVALGGMVAGVLALKAAFAALTMASPIMILVTALAAGAYLITKWVVGGKDIADTFNKVMLVGKGVAEIITSMAEGTGELNEETAQAASEQGVLGVIVKVGMFAYRAKEFFMSLYDAIVENWEFIEGAFGPGIEALQEIFAMFGGSATADIDNVRGAGGALGTVLAKTAQVIGMAFSGAMIIIKGLIDSIYTLMEAGEDLADSAFGATFGLFESDDMTQARAAAKQRERAAKRGPSASEVLDRAMAATIGAGPKGTRPPVNIAAEDIYNGGSMLMQTVNSGTPKLIPGSTGPGGEHAVRNMPPIVVQMQVDKKVLAEAVVDHRNRDRDRGGT